MTAACSVSMRQAISLAFIINSLLKDTDHMDDCNNIILGNKSTFTEQTVCKGPQELDRLSVKLL